MSEVDAIDSLDWAKGDGLLPAIVQHWSSGEILMLGYMNREALAATRAGGRVTFFSRSRQRLWCKGETSGNQLLLKSLHVDCDADSILVRAEAVGPTCHLGTPTCFADAPALPLGFLSMLDALVEARQAERPAASYTTRLFDAGLHKIAQKVGEEGVETALAGVVQGDPELLGEAADLLFHLLVLLRARGLALAQVVDLLQSRHSQ
ncbi:MAG: bifunctional phosphoribosyl-AMP cyclohydrolase/phosphoribosyl-ATP diphosphatase HisIE [Xanthomonadales bacterium]|uniref:bifunctional phosphoribosyl-AMP cyclohydrolase/phosphoribosyl-ATP diphosphatase HisIE n=1 Tax=Dokdonella sp. TaxID=2291710 RepID=UPI002C74A875|nr:bifunctional phosphoribosyl-AMP cyclohydrolase/phosphoribosyl-ATP diphosphatase HisIE [Xanthomonadales bacterium]MBK7209389.1 bifunctional phosphoribosyl-AMP cyclohydrolase/phosphoribosyl-ATP diphosphatase HisIE [Xanthomonadales bacterium]HQZ61418.1 bifunctional phosphoribosyl-AMP cyclohydrolase/phosphoribosyl-ATP diphosphatase HisIE [Dokdonella sp.]